VPQNNFGVTPAKLPDAPRDRNVVGVVTGPFYRQQVMAEMAERADEKGRYETLHQQKFSAPRFFLFHHRVPDYHRALCIAGLHADETWISSRRTPVTLPPAVTFAGEGRTIRRWWRSLLAADPPPFSFPHL
jgi:hypothetical protein